MITKTTTNKVATHPLQTWEWGEFRRAWGNQVERFSFGQITIHPIPYTPWSVAVFDKGGKPTPSMLTELKAYATKHRILFVKIEPNILKNARDVKTLKMAGAVPGKTLFTPTTFWIDVTKSEDTLLASFHPKTRYNIRVAQKKGVSVCEDNSPEAFERYLVLTQETAKRQGFYAHSPKYHRLMWQYLHTDMVKKGIKPIAHLFTASYNNEIITTWILFSWKDFLYYPYGASTNAYKNVMANNLMMWEAIRFGKKMKAKTFDLWGREPGKGFTPFKEGYNPQVVEFLGTWDLVCSPLYPVYRAAEKLRWVLLRLRAKLRT